MSRTTLLGTAVVASVLLMAATGAVAKPSKDRKYARDWQTGVELAPGAYTWTNDNFDQKKQIIADTAAAQTKTCSHAAFLQWPAEAGSIDALKAETRRRYETLGYTVEERPGDMDGRIAWTASHPERQAVVLWGTGPGGATVYLSCLTSGEPAANPDKPMIVAVMLGLALSALGVGLWLVQRTRAMGKASLGWSSAPGTIKSSDVVSYRTKGGPQFKAQVTYGYAVNGRSYSGDQIRFGNYAGARVTADADADKYRPGTHVQVRYDPRDPKKSVLEPGVKGLSVAGLVLASTGVLIAGITAVILFI